MVYFFNIYLILSFLALSACGDGNRTTFIGRIDEQFLRTLEHENSFGRKLIITSSGGDIKTAYKAALNIRENKNTISIKNLCLSACAEDLLPAGHKIYFRDKPIIGFHWNAFMNNALAIEHGADLSLCSSMGLSYQHQIYGFRGLNENFWKETQKRLVLESYHLSGKPSECPKKLRTFKNQWWLPTSKQLKELWGLEFQGSVCADSFNSCKWMIDIFFDEGTRIVVGDEIYVSKGYK
jgi:hypothetical protein